MQSPIGPARRLRCSVAVACCLAAMAVPRAISAQATTAALSGIVVNEAGEPVPDVALSIGQSEATARTDSAGRFEFAAVPWGQIRLRARSLGFAPKDTLLLLQSGLAYTVRLRLVKFIPQLDTVQVQASLAYGKPARYRHTGKFDDFYERRAKRPGTFFTREDIERSGRTKVSELISSVPGVTIQIRNGETHLRVARCTGSTIPMGGPRRAKPAYVWFSLFVDGQRLVSDDPVELLAQFLTSEVETIEVYRGGSQLPMEAVGDACAAVFITTRFSPGSVLGTNR